MLLKIVYLLKVLNNKEWKVVGTTPGRSAPRGNKVDHYLGIVYGVRTSLQLSRIQSPLTALVTYYIDPVYYFFHVKQISSVRKCNIDFITLGSQFLHVLHQSLRLEMAVPDQELLTPTLKLSFWFFFLFRL